MASINDLATAATIASSAVALQSSPTQHSAQPSPSLASPPPPAPLTPSAATATATASSANPIPTPAPAPAPAPASHSSPPAASVLAPPLVSPQQNPAAAQIPAPPASQFSPAGGNAGPTGDQTVDAVKGPGAASPEKKKSVRGAFVVFEGMDRAGKTTQAKLLQQRCIEEGRDVRFMRFPDRTTPIGQMIDAYLRGQTEIEDHVIHLLFSANRWEALKTIKSALTAGTTIICDRYYHSGIVYSAAKQNPSLSLSWAKAPEIGLPRPDLVLFLDLEEAVARQRGGWGGEIYEKGEMQRRVRELFWGLSMGDLESAVGSKGKGGNGRDRRNSGTNGMAPEGEKGQFRQEEEDLLIVDANTEVEELAEKVWEHVLPRLEAVERGEVGETVRIVR